MKKILRWFVINSVVVFAADRLIPGFNVSPGYEGIIITAAVLTGLNFAIKPLIKLLLLPVNLITLGAFRWVANVFILWLVTYMVPNLEVIGFQFVGYTYQGFIIPAMYLGQFWALVVSSFFISLATTFLFWLFK